MKPSIKLLKISACILTAAIPMTLFFQNCSPAKFSQVDVSNLSSSAYCETDSQDPICSGEQEVVKVACNDFSGLQGDMAVSLESKGNNNYELQFGTFADNYWGNGEYDRILNFTIADLSKLNDFTLKQAGFDDWLWIKVNGATVYIGPGQLPNGGGSTQGVESIQLDGNKVITNLGMFNGELSTSWNFDLDVNLKTYLKTGSNAIWMRTIVQGGGESAIKINLNHSCPN